MHHVHRTSSRMISVPSSEIIRSDPFLLHASPTCTSKATITIKAFSKSIFSIFMKSFVIMLEVSRIFQRYLRKRFHYKNSLTWRVQLGQAFPRLASSFAVIFHDNLFSSPFVSRCDIERDETCEVTARRGLLDFNLDQK